jgi:endonuclease-8
VVEGPTAKAYAIRINNEFQSEVVRDVFVKSKRILSPVEELIGRKFLRSDSLGKNILLFFDKNAIRIHLMVFGAIHIYGVDEPLLKPEERVRLMLSGLRKKLVVYNAPIVEVGKEDKILEKLKRELGPDPLIEGWNKTEATRNILKFSGENIGVALLNQSVIAGIGNILRNEILFRAKVDPERKIAHLSNEEIERIVDFAEI